MEEITRGIPSLITDIRKKVFTEVARMAYAGKSYEAANERPYIMVPGDRPLHREAVFLERAIVGERVRLAMGLGLRPSDGRHLVSEGMGCPGTILPVHKTAKSVEKYGKEATTTSHTASPFRHIGEELD